MARTLPSIDRWRAAVVAELQLPSGRWTTELEGEPDVEPDGYEVGGWVLHEGVRVGMFRRGLRLVGGLLEARHDALYLEEAAQGAGFATAYVAHSERAYLAMGVDQVRIDACLQGRLFFARQGVRFARARAEDLVDFFAWEGRTGEDAFRAAAEAAGQDPDTVATFLLGVRAGAFSTPHSLWLTPPGRLLLAEGPDWQGRWPVRAPEASAAGFGDGPASPGAISGPDAPDGPRRSS